MRKVIVAIALVWCACKMGDDKPAVQTEVEKQQQDLDASFVAFKAAVKDIDARLPAPAALTANQACPAGLGEIVDEATASKKRRTFFAIDREMITMFATTDTKPVERLPAFRRIISDDSFHTLAAAWGPGPKTFSLDLMFGLAGVVHVMQGKTVVQPYLVVFVPVEMREPSVVDTATFKPGLIDGWLVVYDGKQQKVICQARVTAKNDDVLGYRGTEPQSYVDGDLENKFWEAAARAIDSIAPGAIIYNKGVKDGVVVQATAFD